MQYVYYRWTVLYICPNSSEYVSAKKAKAERYGLDVCIS